MEYLKKIKHSKSRDGKIKQDKGNGVEIRNGKR
jgi:hypothetical protein